MNEKRSPLLLLLLTFFKRKLRESKFLKFQQKHAKDVSRATFWCVPFEGFPFGRVSYLLMPVL